MRLALSQNNYATMEMRKKPLPETFLKEYVKKLIDKII